MSSMEEPNFIVIRPAPDLPAGFLPPHLDGRWFDCTQVPKVGRRPAGGMTVSEAVAVPTGRFEVRETDGAVAEVFEVRP